MSQAGIVDIEGSHPQIPTVFVANVGAAIPIANILEVLGAAVAAHGVPLQTVGVGNTLSIDVQYASAAASSVATNAGVASFNSAFFSVDANGFVSFTGASGTESFTVDAATAPGTNPVVPNVSGNVTVTGGQVAAGTTANVIRTDSLAANTYTIQIQRSQAVASSTIGDNGVSHFDSSFFTVDGNGFVSLKGSALGETITGDTGGPLSPTGGNWNILANATAGSSVRFIGSVSTLNLNVTDTLSNTLIGAAAGNGTLTAARCTGLGVGVLSSLTSQSDSTAVGYHALNKATSGGAGNDAYGSSCLTLLTSGTQNCSYGQGSLQSLLTGALNISMGSQSGSAYVAAESSNITIGNTGTVGESNTIHIGNQGSGGGQQNRCFVAGIVGITNSNAQVVTINSSTGQLGVTNSAGLTSWLLITTSQTLVKNTGYFCVSAGGALSLALPSSASSTIGDTIRVTLDGATSWTITQATSQQIRFSSSQTTTGTGGSLASTAQGDTIELVYQATGKWNVISSIGNLTVT